MMKKLLIFVLMAAMLVLLAGCSSGNNAQTGNSSPDSQITVPAVSIDISWPGPNPLINQTDANNRVVGILSGVWHGAISPVTLVVSFLNPNVQMYEVHNDGGPYNFGFLIGVAIVFLVLGVFAGSRYR
jgi:hypothetical protein